MKKIIAIGVAMAVILVLASAGPVAATNSSGTLVEPGDSDGGLQCTFLPTQPIGYINSNSIFPPVCDIWEYVYIDVNQLGVVSVGDVRLTNVTFGGITYVAGTQVAYGDVDLGQVLMLLPQAQPSPNNLLIIDVDANGVFSTSDWVYLDLNTDGFVTGPSPAGPDLPATAADLRLTNVNRRGQNYAFGTKVKTLDEDSGLMPLANWWFGFANNWQLFYVDNVGPGLYGPGDTVYIKLPATHFVPNIMTCDLRLTEYPY